MHGRWWSVYHRAVNRYFLAFLLFVGALVAAAAAVAWWFAPHMALFLDADRRDGPAYVFDFSTPGAVAPTESASRGTLMRVVRGEGGRFHYHGELVRLLDGELDVDEWRQIDIYGLEAGSDYLRLATHAEYLRLDGGPFGRQVLTSARDTSVDFSFHANKARVIWLLQRPQGQGQGQGQGQEPMAAAAFLRTSRKHGATPAIQVAVERFSGHRAWDLLIAFEFVDEAAALAWFRSLETQTALAILQSRMVRTAGLLYRDVPI